MDLFQPKKARNPKIPLTKEEIIQREIKTWIACTIGAAICAFNINSFVHAGELFPGGVIGLTLLILRSAESYLHITLPYSAVYLPLNLVPIYFGVRYLGNRFTIYSIYFSVLSSILTDVFPTIPVTDDPMLTSVFGGILNAVSILICLWVGASGGGTDFIMIYLSERKGINANKYIFASNVVILSLAGILFGWDKALYSIIYQYVSTVVNQNFYKRYDKSTLIVITDMPETVYDKISILAHHDATLFQGEGFFMETKKNMIYSVVGSDQVDMLLREIRTADPKAFINVLKSDQVNGRFYRTPRK